MACAYRLDGVRSAVLAKTRSQRAVRSSRFGVGLTKRDHARVIGLFNGEGAAFLACYAAGIVSVLLAVDPLEQDVKQEVTTKNAERKKHRERHWNLARACVNGEPGHGKSRRGRARKS
jgi:hypothetical protein